MKGKVEDYLNYPLIDGPLKALNIKTMHGANYFSGGPIVAIRLDLGPYDEVFTSAIPNFYAKLRAILPSLYGHHCSVGQPGGFFQRVEEGTLLGHVTEHVAIELQTLAGMDVAYGKTRRTGTPGVYNVIFRYFDELAGIYAGKAALNLVNSLLLDLPFDVDRVVAALVEIREGRLLGPSSQAIVAAAEKRGIPWLRLDEYNLIQLGTGRYHKRTRATLTDDTSLVGVEISDDKLMTVRVLQDAGVPAPHTIAVDNLAECLQFARECQRPIVLKPRSGKLGRGVSLALEDPAAIGRALAWARNFDQQVLAQEYIAGNAYRLLVIDYRLAAAVLLTPPQLVGDGLHTVAELIGQLNADPRRGIGDKAELSRVEFDAVSERLLSERKYTMATVLRPGEVLPLQLSGNLKLGGMATDVTDRVDPMTRYLVERAARVVGLNVAGVDIVANSISQSLLEGGAVIEINAAPDFRMHLRPTAGKARDVAGEFVRMLFPPGAAVRMPLFSVTGSHGKTPAVRLIRSVLSAAGYATGMITTDGLYIGDRRLKTGDMSNPDSVALLLKDPTIDCAVMETAHEGIVQKGLGYQFADVGIVLNFDPEDGVGSDDITFIDDLAYAMAVVAEQVYDEGYSVLNADQPLVAEMAERVYSEVVWFSRDYQNQRLRAHVDRGGMATVLDGNDLYWLKGSDRQRIVYLPDLSIDWSGQEGRLDGLMAAVA
ncbi:MAG: Mur ligase family protein, partial [Negativicutes bacterium]|nr:Mur ligase family protein [Negativicutes bacterium]